jgi:hypothetical protein
MRLTYGFLAVALSSVVGFGAVRGGDCPVSDEQFLTQLATMRDWSTIYSVFKQNLPACPDDGFYGEGYTDAVVATLAHRWSGLKDLERLVTSDATFRDFIYRHIDASGDANDLRMVLANAETRCATTYLRLCNDIAARAKAAIADLR